MTRTPLRRPAKLFACLQIVYGASVALGSCGELIAAAIHEALPAEAIAQYAQLHSSPWVSGWVLIQNLFTLPLGLTMVVAAIGLWRGRQLAVEWTRGAALAMIGIGVCGQLVLSLCLYPDLRSGALGFSDGDGEALVNVMVLAGLAMLIWPVIAVVTTRR